LEYAELAHRRCQFGQRLLFERPPRLPRVRVDQVDVDLVERALSFETVSTFLRREE
jgi:hypothetical protein